jgi:uncharacterized protein (TIGR02996 family)
MISEPELLDAIWRNPEDDAPRLVYADWLQERGDPRGKYIHLSCSAASNEEQTELVTQLFLQHKDAWLAPYLQLGARSVNFERGLPASLSAEPKTWAENGAAFLKMAPITQVAVTASSSSHSLAPLFALPEFARIKRLGFYDCVDGDGLVRELTEKPAQLTRLDFWKTRLTAHGVKSLGAWASLRSVRQLSLIESQIDGEAIEVLARSTMLSGLLELALLYNALGPRGARALAESTTLSSLISLDVRSCALEFEGVSAFVDGRGLPALRELKISWNLPEETPERAKARFAYDKPHLQVS